MPSVLRKDLNIVQELQKRLETEGISVWRDQEKIYGGEKWPKVLGEQIAAQDIFLLAWSGSSVKSHYVEFEWCTAIALKKKIVPCLLDATPLPAALKTFHGSDARDLSKAVNEMLPWIVEPHVADPERTAKVLDKLDDIEEIQPQKVLAAAKAMFDQRNWVVRGNVIQGENVTVTIGQRPEEKPKGLLERWQTWVSFVVGVLTTVTLTLGILDKLPWPISSGGGEGKAFDQPLSGQVVDASTGDPLSGVRVSILDFTIEPKTTNEDGYFRFDKVRGAKQERIKLTAGKDCYKVETIEATLGNTELRPALDRLNNERCKR